MLHIHIEMIERLSNIWSEYYEWISFSFLTSRYACYDKSIHCFVIILLCLRLFCALLESITKRIKFILPSHVAQPSLFVKSSDVEFVVNWLLQLTVSQYFILLNFHWISQPLAQLNYRRLIVRMFSSPCPLSTYLQLIMKGTLQFTS